jgi:protein-S-isoprenylcysteine O-methyltransferase Ste14
LFRYVFALFNGVALAVIVFAASGGARPFLAPPQRAWGVALLVIYQTGSIALCGGLGRGERRVRESPVFHLSIQILGLFILLGIPVLDVVELAVFPASGALRTAGLVVALIGLVLRLGSMAQLGARFTHFVLRLEEHPLVTRGFYSHLRHPGYLGMLLVSLGLALVFRSTLGLLLVPVLFGLLVWRIRTEEAFLTEQFGDEYRAYQACTERLVPGVY